MLLLWVDLNPSVSLVLNLNILVTSCFVDESIFKVSEVLEFGFMSIGKLFEIENGLSSV